MSELTQEDKKTLKEMPKFRASPPFKLKDTRGRQYQAIKFKDQFGFTPETIIIEKVHGKSNTFIIIAVLTEEEVKRVDALMAKEELKVKANLDDMEKLKGGENDRTSKESGSKEKDGKSN